MNKFVHTESHTGRKFSKTPLELLYTRGIVVVQLYCVFFLCDVRWRHSKPSNSGPHFLLNFFTSLRKDSVDNYASIWIVFTDC